MQARILSLLALLLFAATAMAQSPEPYATQWKKADSLLNRSLPESARKIVDKVYADAQRTNQSVQMLKSQLYYLRIDASNREDADSLNIARAEEQAKKTAFPVSAVWQSIAAQLYWNYYQQHRYEILQRTKTVQQVGNDFEQWDAAKFVERTSALYLQSLTRAEDLKRLNIEAYDPVLIKGTATRTLRPTLFELLAFRAIDFFENDEKDLTKPAFQFVMDDAVVFAPALVHKSGGRIGKAFTRNTFLTQDTTSLQYRALTLYQEVLRLHKADASPDALIDADLQRLAFAYAHSVHSDKKALYRTALERIEKEYADNPLSATASFRIAELMMQSANTDEDEEDDAPRRNALHASPDLRAVKAKLDAIITKFPESEGGIAAAGLLQTITAPSLSLTAEEAVLPEVPSKIVITYKNIPKTFIRVIKMDADDYRDEGRYSNDDYIKKLLAAKPVQSFSTALPGTEDYVQHSAEVKVNALPFGMYAILISANETFSKTNNAMSFAVTQVTRLSVITQSGTGKGQATGYILHRKEGTPINGATLSFFTQRYNNSTNRYFYTTSATTTSAADGAFRVSGTDHSYNGMSVKKDGDAFYTTEYLNFYRYISESQEVERTFFFTDRSIYRPGQTVFFKGILVHTDADGRNSNVQAGKKVEVTFYDANSQKVASQSLTTNEWGSFTGTFTAPQGGLTGTMHIEGGNGSAYISVEEYKRPKFRVEWDTLKSDYVLGEAVQITGHAAAYAGNNVDGATVKYRVVRNVRWPYWWYSWRFGGGRSAQQQMAEGTATTDADGKFTIRFTAQPNRSIDERSLPVFTYTVYADVTDLNGETRSGQKSIAAGYRSLQIVADIPEQASRKDLNTVRITTQNLNGDFVAASVTIRVTPLAEPNVVYRKRYWPVPDQFTMSEAEFREIFPLDAYKDEDDYRNWKQLLFFPERNVTTTTTTTSGLVTLPAKAFFANGWYCITVAAKDKNGKTVEEKKFVQVWDADATGNLNTMLLAQPQSQVVEPGNSAKVFAPVALNGLFLIRQVQSMDGKIATSQNHLNRGSVNEPLCDYWQKGLTEADRGGIALSYITVKDNRVYAASARIDVPWTNKDLSIEWETHRDKLQPGERETWTMVVRGNKKDKVAAEMAATLYDASLDAFKPHGWGIGSLFPTLNADLSRQTGIGFGQAEGRQVTYFNTPSLPSYGKSYDILDLPGLEFLREGYMYDAAPMGAVSVRARAKASAAMPAMRFSAPLVKKDEELKEAKLVTQTGDANGIDPGLIDKPVATKEPNDIPIRKNLQETAFFYPQLHTDADGAVRIQFTIPEALTEWKLLAFAHTKNMRTGLTTGSVKTQKDLMVQPGLPRFLRQGDGVILSAKIVNLSSGALNGDATLEILDAFTMKPLDLLFNLAPKAVSFNAEKGRSTSVSWTIRVPESRYEPVIVRITATAGNFTDGEENTLPVITNRMLVTETMPLWMNGAGTKTFSFDKLKASGESKTIAQHRLTVEYTANPAWYAIQALPYLMEYPYECSEQTFNRFYANALAAHILDGAPRVKEVFRKWEELQPAALQSNLEKNEELKSALLEETPWVLDAKDETKQKHNIALLFNTAKFARQLDRTAQKLEDMFLPEGGWPWFKGATRPDHYITQYIVTGIGRLKHLGISNLRLERLSEQAITYLDRQIEEEYNDLVHRKVDLKAQHISYYEAQYLYMKSFFRDSPRGGDLSPAAASFWRQQAVQYWPRFNPYVKGMIAIALSRGGDKNTSAVIIQSLKETSIQKEELGMYWMENGQSWWWWEAPIEAQSLLIECFGEVAQDGASVDAMKRWLLKNKQTNRWATTKATADACYALLLQGTQWLEADPEVTVQLGEKTIRSKDVAQEGGTGYFKTAFSGQEIKPEMGNITLMVGNNVQQPSDNRPTTVQQPSWGAVYWQYFENLDKITSAATPLVVKKALFIERNTDRGPLLEPISGNLKIGDKVKARIEIIVDRDMEYVHLKDGRAACFEPVNVLSGYRYQGVLGYYESTKDVSSNFFFDHLPKGKYVFEYPLFVTNAGEYSAGLATIQCIYAPEFSAHSEGVRVTVK